jgi:hypothetical protein
LIKFLQLGLEERERIKKSSLEKQREAEVRMKLEMKQKLEEQEKKMLLKVQEGTTEEILIETEERFWQEQDLHPNT